MGSTTRTVKTQKILGQAMVSQAEHEKEGQYTRLMPMLELDDPMAYQNFIRTPHELFQELEQRLCPEIQERTWMRPPQSRTEVGGHPETHGQWRQLPNPSVCF